MGLPTLCSHIRVRSETKNDTSNLRYNNGNSLYNPHPITDGQHERKKTFLRFTLSAIIIYLTSGTLNSAVAADVNVGEPRTVRLVYLLPNDRAHRAEVVQRMKDEILKVQTFYAEQMEAHGYGKLTFRIETDHQGEPMVHHMDGRYPDASYNATFLPAEVADVFNHIENVYVTVIDGTRQGAYGGDYDKDSGFVVMGGGFTFAVMAHEIGHAFGLSHDFHDDAYIMSYGPGQTRLSACSAEFCPYIPTSISIAQLNS